MINITSSMLNPIKPDVGFEKTLKYLILKKLNGYQGQKAEMRVEIRFD